MRLKTLHKRRRRKMKRERLRMIAARTTEYYLSRPAAYIRDFILVPNQKSRVEAYWDRCRSEETSPQMDENTCAKFLALAMGGQRTWTENQDDGTFTHSFFPAGEDYRTLESGEVGDVLDAEEISNEDELSSHFDNPSEFTVESIIEKINEGLRPHGMELVEPTEENGGILPDDEEE